jgi:hypothetical protein
MLCRAGDRWLGRRETSRNETYANDSATEAVLMEMRHITVVWQLDVRARRVRHSLRERRQYSLLPLESFTPRQQDSDQQQQQQRADGVELRVLDQTSANASTQSIRVSSRRLPSTTRSSSSTAYPWACESTKKRHKGAVQQKLPR